MPRVITDSQLVQLYTGFTVDYLRLQQSSWNNVEIYAEIRRRLEHSLEHENSSLYGLEEQERDKARAFLSIFIRSNENEEAGIRHQPAVIDRSTIHYCDQDETVNWGYLSSLLPVSDSDDDASACRCDSGLLYFLTFMALMAIAALVAFYYMLSEFLNSMERFIYNEGWFKAGLSLASMVAGAALGASLGVYIAAIPLIIMGVTLGVTNPFGLAVAGAVCLAIMFAAATCVLTKLMQPDQNDALDPKDASRYALTDAETRYLESNDLDPVKVKYAIIALRQQMGKNGAESLPYRIFTERGREKQGYLQCIRQLRRGELREIEVGGKLFNLTSGYLADEDDSPSLDGTPH